MFRSGFLGALRILRAVRSLAHQVLKDREDSRRATPVFKMIWVAIVDTPERARDVSVTARLARRRAHCPDRFVGRAIA